MLAVGSIMTANIVPDEFPVRNFSSLYLMILAVCFIFYNSYRMLPTGGLKNSVLVVSWMILFLIFFRCVKYSIVVEVGAWARFTWYLYYVPSLLMPQFLFYVSLFVSSGEERPIPRKWEWTLVISIILILLVLTNDLHQQVFAFKPGFENWDGDYSYGWPYYVITVWEYGLYLVSVIILVAKCRLSISKKSAGIILIPFFIGVIGMLLLMFDKMPKINGHNPFEFPETLCFMVTGILECCIQLGLVPTNDGYSRLFKVSSVAAQITDRNGKIAYISEMAEPLTAEQFALPDGARIEEHTVLRKIEIPGGFGFWVDDVTEPDRLNSELVELGNSLSEKIELTRLQNELKEKQAKIEQRTIVYDTIAQRVQRQSVTISKLAAEARNSSDVKKRERNRKYITMLGAYIKRYANLMLISADSRTVSAGELGISAAEVLRYLNFFGIPGDIMCTTDSTLRAEAALGVFEALELLLEEAADELEGVFINISDSADGTVFKMTMENHYGPFPDEVRRVLADAQIETKLELEDETAYFCFNLTAGGESA